MYLFVSASKDVISDNFASFLERSKKLCKAWESTLLLMTKLPSSSTITSNSTLGDFQRRVREGMKTYFNSTVYQGMITQTIYYKNSSKVNKLFILIVVSLIIAPIATSSFIQIMKQQHALKT